MPRSAQVGGREAMMKRITGELRAEIREAVKANIARRGGADADDQPLRRRSVVRGPAPLGAGGSAGVEPEEFALMMLEKGDASLVSFNMSEDDIEHIMRQPWTMTCTDGDLVPMGQGKPHPRAYGAFPRKLKRYVRERGTLGLPTRPHDDSLPATVFGLRIAARFGRGLRGPGDLRPRR